MSLLEGLLTAEENLIVVCNVNGYRGYQVGKSKKKVNK